MNNVGITDKQESSDTNKIFPHTRTPCKAQDGWEMGSLSMGEKKNTGHVLYIGCYSVSLV